MTDLSTTFRRNVRHEMDRRRMSPFELGKMLGKDPTIVRVQIIQRDGSGTGVTLSTVERYAQALGVSPLALLDNERAS